MKHCVTLSVIVAIVAVTAITGCENSQTGTEAETGHLSPPPLVETSSEVDSSDHLDGAVDDGAVEAFVALPPPAELDLELCQTLSKGLAGFTVGLYSQLRDGSSNLAFSPASISVAFAMLHGGSRGDTADEISKALGYDLPTDQLSAGYGALLRYWNRPRESYRLAVANRVFAEKTERYEPAFLKLTGEHFGAPLERVSFKSAPGAARKQINDWVAQQTEDRIRDLVPANAITSETRMALVNALYFKGKWTRRFRTKQTRDEMFKAQGTREIKVKMMRQKARMPFRHDRENGLKVLEMPYLGDDLSMVVILPDRDDGLSEIEELLSAERLDAWISALRKTNVSVKLPRFRVEAPRSIRLKSSLRKLGLKRAFLSGAADLSGIAPPPGRLFVHDAFHKAYVDVNEEGTEGAAGTAVVIRLAKGPGSSRPRIAQFHATHPFLFLIRDRRTGMILFFGRVMDPSAGG